MAPADDERRPVVLHLRGDIDADSQLSYRLLADQLMANEPTTRLLVDMSELDSIDSSGLGLLVHLQALANDHEAALALNHVPPRAAALLARTGLNQLFQVHEGGPG